MYGIEQITANNGWAMAAAGACIVLTGLSVLSLIISLFPKIFKLMEPDMPAGTPAEDNGEKEPPAGTGPLDLGFLQTDDMATAAKMLALLAADLGASFDLKDLFSFLRQNDIANPHMIVRELREQACLVPADEGLFCWNV